MVAGPMVASDMACKRQQKPYIVRETTQHTKNLIFLKVAGAAVRYSDHILRTQILIW